VTEINGGGALSIVCLALGLIILIVVNIVLGSLGAIFQNVFNREKLLRGLIKAGIVVLCFAATYLVGYLNPGIVAIEVNGIEVTVMTGIQLVVLVGYYHYAKQVIDKLTAIIKGNMFVEEAKLHKASTESVLQAVSDESGAKEHSKEHIVKQADDIRNEQCSDSDENRKNADFRVEGTISLAVRNDDV